jgi:peptidyl-prolyl cis-trans isomerase C
MALVVAAMLFHAVAQGETVLIDGPEVDLFQDDLAMALRVVPLDLRVQVLQNKAKLREIMDTTYMTKVAAHRARQKGLDKVPEIQAQIWNRTENVLAVAEMESSIEKEGKPDFAQAAMEHYKAHPEKYALPEMIAASHILIGVDGRTEAEALQQITELRARILGGEIGFEDAARQFSTDIKSGSQGGSLGRFGRGQMVPPFEEAAFALAEKGALSEPVKSRFGYHLIRLEERFPAGPQPFDQIKGKIMEELEKTRRAQLREEYLIAIRDDPSVKLDEALIKGLLENPAALLAPQQGEKPD